MRKLNKTRGESFEDFVKSNSGKQMGSNVATGGRCR